MTRFQWRRVGHAGLALLLLAATAVMWKQMPTTVESWAPITVDGAVGERTIGRNIEVTVVDARQAKTVTFSSRGTVTRLSSSGAWLVLTVTYGPTVKPASPSFALEVGKRTYVPHVTTFGASDEQPDLPRTGLAVFELPATVRSATLLVANETMDIYGNRLTAPLDSQIEVPLTLEGQPAGSLDLDQVRS